MKQAEGPVILGNAHSYKINKWKAKTSSFLSLLHSRWKDFCRFFFWFEMVRSRVRLRSFLVCS